MRAHTRNATRAKPGVGRWPPLRTRPSLPAAHTAVLLSTRAAIPIEGLISALRRGGITPATAKQYLRAAEKHLFHYVLDEQRQMLVERNAKKDDPAWQQAMEVAWQEVVAFRSAINAGATLDSAMAASIRGPSRTDGQVDVEIRAPGDVAPVNTGLTKEEMFKSARPDLLKQMPPHQHSYVVPWAACRADSCCNTHPGCGR